MALRKEDAKRTKKVCYEKGGYSIQYIFDCSTCDGEISTSVGYMLKHSGKCRSCSQRKRPFQAAFNNLVNNRHKITVPVTLTYEQFFELTKFPDCHYCGTALNRNAKKDTAHYRSYLLDRKDNSVGYTFDNCVPCCWPCNQTKGNRYTYEEFLAIGRGLAQYRAESGKPHWTDDFGWDDGDSNPDPYYGEMLLTTR